MVRSSLIRVTKGTLRLLSRPVRRAQGRGGIVLEPYRGYGSCTAIFLIGRVFRQRHATREADRDSLADLWRDTRRRIARRAVREAAVTARFCGSEQRVVTDRDGYFRIHLEPRHPPQGPGPWHGVDLVLEADPPVAARAEVFIPPRRARCAVISDIDDTVMHTGVANKLVMLWRLFVEDAASRVAFPGVATLYRALHEGGTGAEGNPMLYVSRAPWGLYEVLTEFFRRHAIPEGPILFLREWGLSWTHPLPRRAEDHKRVLIAHMLELYRDLPIVLIGDSGQHDPEVYARVVAENPGRVRAIYIRNVSADAGRIAEIERIAEIVTRAGASFVLAADSVAMAEHAAGLGLIAPEAVAMVANERAAAPPEPAIGPLQGVLRPSEPPPTLVVEPEAGKPV